MHNDRVVLPESMPSTGLEADPVAHLRAANLLAAAAPKKRGRRKSSAKP